MPRPSRVVYKKNIYIVWKSLWVVDENVCARVCGLCAAPLDVKEYDAMVTRNIYIYDAGGLQQQ